MDRALILLSGLDSAVALHWALDAFPSVEALSFWYGQPHAAAEVAAAQEIARRRGVPWVGLNIAEAVRGLNTIAPAAPGLAGGVSRANLPARNAILLSVAAAHAARAAPDQRTTLVIGANVDDALGFPDCRPPFLKAAGEALSAALAGVAEVSVRAPWVEMCYRKAAIVRWAAGRPEALADARLAVSCYRGVRCGQCDACALRAAAFQTAGVDDGTDSVRVHGGDPQRERGR